MRLLLTFLLCLAITLPSVAVVEPLGFGESIDDFFGRASHFVTRRDCDIATSDEYYMFRCNLSSHGVSYKHADDGTFISRQGDSYDAFFQNVTDNIVFNTAAQSVYSMNKCQVDFFKLYQNSSEHKTELEDRVIATFNEIRKEVVDRKKEIVKYYAPTPMESMTLPCSTSADCAVQTMALDNRVDDKLEIDRRISELLSTVPMGNRHQMRNYLLSVVDKPVTKQ